MMVAKCSCRNELGKIEMNANSKKRMNEILDRLSFIKTEIERVAIKFGAAKLASAEEDKFDKEIVNLNKEFNSLIEEAKRICV